MLSIFTAIAGVLPVIGPIVQGIGGIVSTVINGKVQIAQTEAGVTTAGLQSTNQLVMAMASDAAVKFCRDIIMFPGSIYCGTIIWDRWVEMKYPALVWGVKPLQGPLEYL